MARIVFIHGLNTFGDGLIHIGPLTFGRMDTAWKKSLAKHGLPLYSVPDLGFGPTHEQVERAFSYLKSEGLLDGKEKVTLVGHSLGGLIAKALAHKPEVRANIQSVITVGTPHSGATVAKVADDFDKKSPLLHALFKIVGYDIIGKREAFAHFTVEKLREFSNNHPLPEGVRGVSLMCDAKLPHLSVPLRAVYTKLHGPQRLASDGFISCESQVWAEQGGTFALDHFDQMGAFIHATWFRRRRAQKEFARLIETVVQIAKS